MKKGVVLEINHHYVTVLTPEGDFIRTRKLPQNYHVGEEIYFYPAEFSQEPRFNFLAKVKNFKVVAILPAVLILGIFFLPFYSQQQVSAYMSIDVNPSIELGLNDELEVVGIEAYNEEGQKIIGKLTEWKWEDVIVVTNMILAEIEKQGFLQEQHEVVISTTNKKDEEFETVLEETVSEVAQKAAVEEELDVTVVTATEEERQNAVELGITPGLYKQQNHSVKQGIHVKEKLSNKPVQQSQPPSDNQKQNTDEKVDKLKPKQQTEVQQKVSSPTIPKNGNTNKDNKETKANHGQEKKQQNIDIQEKAQKNNGKNQGNSENAQKNHRKKEEHKVNNQNNNKSPKEKVNQNRGNQDQNGNSRNKNDQIKRVNGNDKGNQRFQ
ncbi:anti-sigma factor domain-containing protein [Mesobacillus maritimus]|uniref:anti-sigma-I factor RsgI family protein n=1 Tax=Mesobacillus maritimus TaxID=1643336 RepID=UPI00203FB357|nr:anti-sigma factor domain-containing protein [Mesobacillus maritimus]MCM3667550.1 anti-sigma factor domain-containing protein [Mesobacillus maritimus]